jgi:hypothetical protein
VTIGATTLVVMEADEVEPGIRELRCASAVRPWRKGDSLLSVYAHGTGAVAFRSLEEARASLNVVALPRARARQGSPLRP